MEEMKESKAGNKSGIKKETKPGSMGELEDLDFQIMDILRDDGRITMKELGSRIELYGDAVAKRIRKLEELGFIKGYSVLVDYDTLGFAFTGIVRIGLTKSFIADNGEFKDILSIPQVAMVCSLTGPSDIIALIRGKDPDEVLSIVNKISKNPIVSKTVLDVVLKTHKQFEEFNPLSQEQRQQIGFHPNKKRLDPLDYSLLRILRKDSRSTLEVLSEKLSAPISTVKDRIGKLVRRGLIRRYVADLDFEKLGYQIRLFCTIELEKGMMNNRTLVEQMLSIPELESLYATAGLYDMHLTIRAKDQKHSEELLGKITQMEGINRTSTFVVLSTMKDFIEFNPLDGDNLKR